MGSDRRDGASMIHGIVAGSSPASDGGGGGTDPYYGSIGVLLHLDGADASTTFTDSGPSGKIVTAVGNAQIDTAQSVFGGASLLLDGAGDYLTHTGSAMSFATGSFTVEAWLRFASTSDHSVLAGISDSNYDFAFVGSTIRVGRVNTAWDSSVSFTRSTNTWYHVAWCRDGTNLRIFVDGAQQGSTLTNSNAYNAASGFYVGTATAGDRNFHGHIDDLRVTAGVARYVANFTPPAAPFPDD